MKVFSVTAPAETNIALELPTDARVLSFSLTMTNPVIELFMLGDESAPSRTRTFSLVRTGEEFYGGYTYIGSRTVYPGDTYHLFETKRFAKGA